MGLATKSFEDAFDFLKSDYKTLVNGMLKIFIVAGLVGLLGAVPYFLVNFSFKTSGNYLSNPDIVLLVASFVIYLIALIISGAISNSSLQLVDSTYMKTNFEGCLSWAKKNLIRTTLFYLLNALVMVLFLAPAFLLLFTNINSVAYNSSILFEFLALLILGIGLMLVWSLFTYIAKEEYFISKKGLFESIGSSIKLIKSNFLSALGFALGPIVTVFVLMIPFMLLSYLVSLFGALIIILAVAVNPIVGAIVAIVFYVLAMIAFFAYASLVNSVNLSLSYFFWRNISGKNSRNLPAIITPQIHISEPPKIVSTDNNESKKPKKKSRTKKSE